jgi:hypothetical protein
MSLRSLFVFAALMVFAVAASAQIIAPVGPTGPFGLPGDAFQVRYAANLLVGESFVDMVNDGAANGAPICVSVYGFDNNEELLDCCTCSITANGLASIPVHAGVLANTLTGKVPASAVIKLVVTNDAPANCTVAGAAANGVTTATRGFSPGLRAWGTTLHATVSGGYSSTETPFAFAGDELSAAEYTHLTSFCNFINLDGTTQGICPGCGTTALGANTKL